MAKTDYNALRLKHQADPEKLDEILQEECREKCAQKLHDTLRCESFLFPSLALAEMATSDDVAEIHAHLIEPGTTLLDMTSGLGIDTFHFAARGVNVTAIESDPVAFDKICHNIDALSLSNCRIANADSMKWLRESDESFDTIYIDPARRDSRGRHFSLAECQPDVEANLQLLLSRCSKLIIKTTPMADITELCRRLGRVISVKVIGTVKECKELVIICAGLSDTDYSQDAPYNIESITVGHPSFSYLPAENRAGSIILSSGITPGEILYEPYPSVMKGGGFAALSQRFNLPRLHPNTTLFIGPEDWRIADFPGEQFEIEEVIPFNKKSVKDFRARYPKINVAVRNFPLSAPELAKKLKVSEGGDKRLFGVTATGDTKLLLVTSMAL